MAEKSPFYQSNTRMSIIGGSIGILVGMYLFRHKMQKRKFNLGIPAILLVQAILAYFIFLR